MLRSPNIGGGAATPPYHSAVGEAYPDVVEPAVLAGIAIDAAIDGGLTRVVEFYHNKRKTTMFSETVKSLRIQKRLTLRDFCEQVGLDASNWSKVERGVNPPPSDVDVLERLADFFGLRGADKLSLLDEAALQRREIPADVADNVILQRALPAFFRAARGHELTPTELKNLAADIKKLHTPDRK